MSPLENEKRAELVVFLKTSEEAKCDEVSVCNWVYTNSLPTVETMTPEFDSTTNNWQVKIVGTSFEGVADLQINGVSQESLSQSETMLVFVIT